MTRFFTTDIGRLRVLGFLEGLSFILLVFIAMPLKYFAQDPTMVKILGRVHGGLVIFFIVYTVIVASERSWKLTHIPLKLIFSSFLPFGTFYVDKKYLADLHNNTK